MEKRHLNSGFTLSYLTNQKSKFLSWHEIDYLQKLLSSFTVEDIISYKGKRELTQSEKGLIFVYDNIISRGLPTYCSLDIESYLTSNLKAYFDIKEVEVNNGNITFNHDKLKNSIKAEELWFKELANAHVITDKNYNPIILYSQSDFDSLEEYQFYVEDLPELIGVKLAQLFERQRTFSSMVPENVGNEFILQSVDFAYEDAHTKICIEIDGPQHQDPVQHQLDIKRRDILRNNNWKVIEIPTQEIHDGLSSITIHEIKSTLRIAGSIEMISSDLSSSAEHLVKIPYLIARIQKSIIESIKTLKLSFEDEIWHLGIIERGFNSSVLAVCDLYKNLYYLNCLQKNEIKLPKIVLTIFTDDVLNYENYNSYDEISIQIKNLDELKNSFAFDLLIDNSLEHRYRSITLNQDFYSNFIHSFGNVIVIRSDYHSFDERKINSIDPIPYSIEEPYLEFFLQTIFRKKAFREGQVEILKRALALKPVIGLLPTGAGKSLTYQLSAFLQPGVTLVIDPLRSLMFDQADNLKDNLIDIIEFINSEQSKTERSKIIDKMSSGSYQIVFISPERLQIRDFRTQLKNFSNFFSIPYLVIDEAHCVSEWGHDFRTSYLNLSKTVRTYCKYKERYEPVVIALTGTASYAVLTDVQREINVEDEEAKISPKSFDREELSFNIIKIPTNRKTTILQGILQNYLPAKFNCSSEEFLKTNGELTNSGLVFVPHTNGEFGLDVKEFLRINLKSDVNFYSGSVPNVFAPKLPQAQRETKWNQNKKITQNRFKVNDFPLLVSTKAFGMGIDKPNIRYTIHYGVPQSLESFYQEAGRAGRDQKKACCILLFSDDSATNTDMLLDLTKSADEIGKIPELPRNSRGDAQRIMYFQKEAFQGIDIEKKEIYNVLKTYFYPNIKYISKNSTLDITIPFGVDGNKNLRDKTIYRLSIVGVIDDYTVEYNAKVFEVSIKDLDDSRIIENLKKYVSKYKNIEFVNKIDVDLVVQKGSNILEKCLGYLIEFVYNEIEKKRRAAIKTMIETARESSIAEDKDSAIREKLLSYLEKSIFSELLVEMIKRFDDKEWWEILSKADDIDKTRQLLGGCKRTLESEPDYPGLYFLSGFARMLLPKQNVELAMKEFSDGLKQLKNLFNEQINRQSELALSLLVEYRKHFQDNNNELFELVLDEIPTREVSIYLFESVPQKATLTILKIIKDNLRKFSNQYLEGLQNGFTK